ncbi:hypothetical protein [Methylobacterium oxalidis]|uniref:hypothetical protein n=1 Tax=Methylobacterium oxalidis TaxID=944322 RepID=UPI0033160802
MTTEPAVATEPTVAIEPTEPTVATEPAMTAMTAMVLRSCRDRSHHATGNQRKRGVTGDTGRSETDVHGTFSLSSLTQGHGSSAGWEIAALILSRPGQA